MFRELYLVLDNAYSIFDIQALLSLRLFIVGGTTAVVQQPTGHGWNKGLN